MLAICRLLFFRLTCNTASPPVSLPTNQIFSVLRGNSLIIKQSIIFFYLHIIGATIWHSIFIENHFKKKHVSGMNLYKHFSQNRSIVCRIYYLYLLNLSEARTRYRHNSVRLASMLKSTLVKRKMLEKIQQKNYNNKQQGKFHPDSAIYFV